VRAEEGPPVANHAAGRIKKTSHRDTHVLPQDDPPSAARPGAIATRRNNGAGGL